MREERSAGKKVAMKERKKAGLWVAHSACWKVVPRVGSKVARWAVL